LIRPISFWMASSATSTAAMPRNVPPVMTGAL
jgi:hypothetical protein